MTLDKEKVLKAAKKARDQSDEKREEFFQKEIKKYKKTCVTSPDGVMPLTGVERLVNKILNKGQTMTEQLTEVAVVVDESGSMSPQEEDVVGGFETFIEEQREDDIGDTNVTVTLFSSDVRMINESEHLDSIETLESRYSPGGATALNDAIGKTIEYLEDVEEGSPRCDCGPDNIVVLIITDGKENASEEYTNSDLRSKIEEKKSEGWEFVFQGQIDSMEEASKRGIDHSSKYTKGNEVETYASASRAVTDTKLHGSVQSDWDSNKSEG